MISSKRFSYFSFFPFPVIQPSMRFGFCHSSKAYSVIPSTHDERHFYSRVEYKVTSRVNL